MASSSPPPAPPQRPAKESVARRAMRISTKEGTFAIQYGTLTGGPLLIAFLLALGASEFQIGLVVAFQLLAGVVQPLGAEVVRWRNGWRKGVCVASATAETVLWSVSCAAVVFMPLERAVPVIIVVLAFQYGLSGWTGVAWTSWISDLVPPPLRGRYFGFRNFVNSAFGAVTAFAAGQVVKYSAFDPIPTYLALIASGVVFRGVSIYLLCRQPEPFPARNAAGSWMDRLTQPFADPAYGRYLTYEVMWAFAQQVAAPFFTVYIIRELGLGTDVVMLMAALSIVSNLIGQRFWGPLCDRYGDRAVMRTAGLIVALQPLWWLFTGPVGWGFYLMLSLSIIGGFAWSGQLLATGNLKMRLSPDLGKTSFFAVQGAVSGLSGALGPILGGILADVLLAGGRILPFPALDGLKTLFLISAALRLVGWGLLSRVPAPQRPRLQTVWILRSAVRSFNVAQGLSPLLHTVTRVHDRFVAPRAPQPGQPPE